MLLEAFATSSYFVYPTAYPETGCLTCLKAMAMGCIPITSRYVNSSLPHLIGSYDLGPPQPLVPNLSEEDMVQWFQKDWIPSLQAVSRKEKDPLTKLQVERHRLAMMEETRSRYTWRRIAEQFHELILAPKTSPG
jgi:glycosyltransferase involved in cell wall biosynthesis